MEDAGPCPLCGDLKDKEYAYRKYGWENEDEYLGESAYRLDLIADLAPFSGRLSQIKRCPECGAWFHYRTEYEFLVNGSEDEEFLTRLTESEARGMMGR